jgi:hypothetical protein
MKEYTDASINGLIGQMIAAGVYLPERLVRQPMRENGVWTAVVAV